MNKVVAKIVLEDFDGDEIGWTISNPQHDEFAERDKIAVELDILSPNPRVLVVVFDDDESPPLSMMGRIADLRIENRAEYDESAEETEETSYADND